MSRWSLLALLLLAASTRDGRAAAPIARQDEPLPVRIEGPAPGPHYVGQAIPIRVVVTAEGTEPAIEPPEHPDAEVIAVGDEVRPISAGAIGAIVHETNLYRFGFLIVPRRPGPLLLPAFRARLDGRSGASGPTRLEPRQPPGAGRPAWFLGGIGPMNIELIARPEAIRLGDSVVVEVRLEGLGALGSTIRPALRIREEGESGARVEALPLPPISSTSPTSRTYPFRLRPERPGRLTIDPVLASWFEPASKSYRTVGSGGLSIRVDDPPRFDPGSVEVAFVGEESEGAEPEAGRLKDWIGTIGAAAIVAVLGAVAVRRARRRGRSPRRYAALQARRLAGVGGARRAELAAGALAGYLERAIGRPEGELTPPEASQGVAEATGDAGLADRAAKLVIACDAARYSGRDERGGRASDLEDADGLLRDLSHVEVTRREGRSRAFDDDRE